MRTVEHYISCLTYDGKNRFITVMDGETPRFEEETEPLSFKPVEADQLCRRLNALGWVPIIVRANSDFIGSNRFKNRLER